MNHSKDNFSIKFNNFDKSTERLEGEEDAPFAISLIKKYLECVDNPKNNKERIAKNCIQTLELYSKKGFDLTEKNEKNQNALFFACQGKSVPLINYLVDRKCSAECIDKKGDTILFKAIKHYRSVEVLVHTLELAINKINHINNRGETVISRVCYSNECDKDFLMNLIMNKEAVIPNEILNSKEKKYETLKRMIKLGGGMTIENLARFYETNKHHGILSQINSGDPILLIKIFADLDKIFMYRNGEHKKMLDNVLKTILRDVDKTLKNPDQYPYNYRFDMLQDSIHCNHSGMLLILLKRGFDVNQIDDVNKENLLFHAVEYSGRDVMMILMTMIDNINHTNNQGDTVLHKVCKSGRRDSHLIIKIMLIAKIDPFIENKNKKTALDLVIEYDGNSENMFLVLYDDPRLSESMDSNGRSVFERCLIHEKHSFAIYIILYHIKNMKKGVGVKYDEYLYYSIKHNSIATMAVLLNLNINHSGKCPIINKKILNSSYKNKGPTNFQMACMQQDPFLSTDIIKNMINNSADVNLPIRDQENSTVLHWAVKNNNKDLVKLLLENNANIKTTDDKGKTALEWCISDNKWTERTEIFNLIIGEFKKTNNIKMK